MDSHEVMRDPTALSNDWVGLWGFIQTVRRNAHARALKDKARKWKQLRSKSRANRTRCAPGKRANRIRCTQRGAWIENAHTYICMHTVICRDTHIDINKNIDNRCAHSKGARAHRTGAQTNYAALKEARKYKTLRMLTFGATTCQSTHTLSTAASSLYMWALAWGQQTIVGTHGRLWINIIDKDRNLSTRTWFDSRVHVVSN